MGLLERRRLLFQNAADSVLDGKYVAFIGMDSHNSGSIFLSSNYGKSFEKVLNYSTNFPRYMMTSVGISLDVVLGEPIVYFCSASSNSAAGIYKYNHSTREVSLIGETHLPSYVVATTALQSLDGGGHFYAKLQRDHYVEPGNQKLGISASVGIPMFGGCKSRNKGRHFVFAARYSPYNSNANGLWASNFENYGQFRANVQGIYAIELPSGSRPTDYLSITDADINPQGTVVAYNIYGTGLAIRSEQEQTWRLLDNSLLLSGSVFTRDVSFSENRTFISFISSQYREYLACFSSNSPAPNNLEFVSPLLYDGEIGVPASGSLWSNKRGDKLVKASTDYSRYVSSVQYSHDGGLSWNKSLWNSGSSVTGIWGMSVYRT